MLWDTDMSYGIARFENGMIAASMLPRYGNFQYSKDVTLRGSYLGDCPIPY